MGIPSNLSLGRPRGGVLDRHSGISRFRWETHDSDRLRRFRAAPGPFGMCENSAKSRVASRGGSLRKGGREVLSKRRFSRVDRASWIRVYPSERQGHDDPGPSVRALAEGAAHREIFQDSAESSPRSARLSQPRIKIRRDQHHFRRAFPVKQGCRGLGGGTSGPGTDRPPAPEGQSPRANRPRRSRARNVSRHS